jgi:hypothetical protein
VSVPTMPFVGALPFTTGLTGGASMSMALNMQGDAAIGLLGPALLRAVERLFGVGQSGSQTGGQITAAQMRPIIQELLADPAIQGALRNILGVKPPAPGGSGPTGARPFPPSPELDRARAELRRLLATEGTAVAVTPADLDKARAELRQVLATTVAKGDARVTPADLAQARADLRRLLTEPSPRAAEPRVITATTVAKGAK